MPRVTGPAFSLDAHGTLARTLTWAHWRRRLYAKKRGLPKQPRPPAQASRRALFRLVTTQWPALPDANKATWHPLALTANVSPIAAYTGHNLIRWFQFHAPGQTHPVTETGDLPTFSFVGCEGGPRHIKLAFWTAQLNDGWGFAVHRNLTDSFPTTPENAVGFAPLITTGLHYYTDRPPAPGTYYYTARAFTNDGKLGYPTLYHSGTAT